VDGDAREPVDKLLGLPNDAAVQMSLALEGGSLHALVSVEQPAVAMMMTIELAALVEQLRGLLPSMSLGKAGSMLDMVHIDDTRTKNEHMLVVEFGPPEQRYGSAK